MSGRARPTHFLPTTEPAPGAGVGGRALIAAHPGGGVFGPRGRSGGAGPYPPAVMTSDRRATR